jgi:hypothetical protein
MASFKPVAFLKDMINFISDWCEAPPHKTYPPIGRWSGFSSSQERIVLSERTHIDRFMVVVFPMQKSRDFSETIGVTSTDSPREGQWLKANHPVWQSFLSTIAHPSLGGVFRAQQQKEDMSLLFLELI